jgi:hypothetical protein
LIFCGERTHARAEAVVYFEKVLNGSAYAPPPALQGHYVDVPVGAAAPWYSKWIYAAYDDGLVQECEDPSNRGDLTFRPLDPLTRAEAACMMAMAKGWVGP